MNPYIEESMKLDPTTPSEIRKIINKLPNNNGSGFKDIPTRIIKNNDLYFSNLISDMINEPFETGIYPAPLQESIIWPLHRNNEKHVINNYRPLYKIHNIAKIYQKVICNGRKQVL